MGVTFRYFYSVSRRNVSLRRKKLFHQLFHRFPHSFPQHFHSFSTSDVLTKKKEVDTSFYVKSLYILQQLVFCFGVLILTFLNLN